TVCVLYDHGECRAVVSKVDALQNVLCSGRAGDGRAVAEPLICQRRSPRRRDAENGVLTDRDVDVLRRLNDLRGLAHVALDTTDAAAATGKIVQRALRTHRQID